MLKCCTNHIKVFWKQLALLGSRSMVRGYRLDTMTSADNMPLWRSSHLRYLRTLLFHCVFPSSFTRYIRIADQSLSIIPHSSFNQVQIYCSHSVRKKMCSWFYYLNIWQRGEGGGKGGGRVNRFSRILQELRRKIDRNFDFSYREVGHFYWNVAYVLFDLSYCHHSCSFWN